MIVYFCKIKNEIIDYFIDTTPNKAGKFMPGSHLYIQKYNKSSTNKIDYIFLGAWNFKKEIFKKERKYIKIRKEFQFKNLDNLKKGPYFEEVNKQNTVSICIRQNRFIEGRGQNTYLNKKKSWKFTLEQIDYINKSADYIKSKIPNPIFLLWSNDFSNIQKDKFNFTYKEIKIHDDKIVSDKRIQSLYLLTQCKHYIVTTSTFNWWGCWLSENPSKIVFRPSDNLFSEFRTNNEDFWPSRWNKVN